MQTDFTLILALQPAPVSFSNTGCQKSFQALHTPKHRIVMRMCKKQKPYPNVNLRKLEKITSQALKNIYRCRWERGFLKSTHECLRKWVLRIPMAPRPKVACYCLRCFNVYNIGLSGRISHRRFRGLMHTILRRLSDNSEDVSCFWYPRTISCLVLRRCSCSHKCS